MSKTWIITGSARGLGRAITEAALAVGHRVFATARTPEHLAKLQQQYPGQLHTFALDVTDAAAARKAAEEALRVFGRIDVLVNNAGYGTMLPFEQFEEAAFRTEVETNFFGVVNLARAVLPAMRAQKSGHIINISSVGGRLGTPGMTAYQAAKWAVGGFTEVLAQETAPFGVEVIAVEPGGMRTDWAATARGGDALRQSILPDYKPSVGAMHDMIKAYGGNEIGDPKKVAQVVLDLAGKRGLPKHLILGTDALFIYKQAEEARQKEAEQWEGVSKSTDFEGADLSLLSRFGEK